jgi:hypothetical protein
MATRLQIVLSAQLANIAWNAPLCRRIATLDPIVARMVPRIKSSALFAHQDISALNNPPVQHSVRLELIAHILGAGMFKNA